MKKIAMLSIITVIAYATAVCLFLIFKTEVLLTFWEISTILSAYVVLCLVTQISKIGNTKFRKAIVRFTLGMAVFSTLAHIINLLITRPLITAGHDIPTYFQIGYWFSTEMLMDYIGWGLCLGIAFILLFFSLKQTHKVLAATSMIIGILCILGFIGGMWNQNLWYFAPAGYGIGLMILCFEILLDKSFGD